MKSRTIDEKVTSEDEVINYWGNKVRRGFLHLIILKKFQDLENGERIVLNGQEIKEYIIERTNSGWIPSPGSIYPILSVMEEHKLIKKIDSTNKKNKNYTVTDFGEELYHKLMKEALIFREPNNKGTSFIDIPEYKDALIKKYRNKSIRQIKSDYEKFKSISNFLEEYLKERIIQDKDI